MKTVLTQTRLSTVELCDVKEKPHAMRYVFLFISLIKAHNSVLLLQPLQASIEILTLVSRNISTLSNVLFLGI